MSGSQSGIQSKFQVRLGYMARWCLKKSKMGWSKNLHPQNWIWPTGTLTQATCWRW
jgi:hypothetical protein